MIVADEAKAVAQLGAFPLPVEIVPFAFEWTVRSLAQLGCSVEIRRKQDEGFMLRITGIILLIAGFSILPVLKN